MISCFGDFAEDATVRIPWHSFEAGGASITASGFVAGDIVVYKDGNTTEKTSTNGVTIATDFDSKTGLHLITLDTSNDTGDVGFWVTGSDYLVAVDAVVVDSQTLRFWVAGFSIERAGGAIALIAALNNLSTAQVNTEVDIALVDYDGPTNAEMIARTLIAAGYFDPAADAVANVTLVATTTTNTDMVAEAPTANQNADTTLRRTYANARVSSDGDVVNGRSLLGAVGKLVNRVGLVGTTLTVFQEDDTTSTAPGFTQAVTTDAAADPIIQVDTT